MRGRTKAPSDGWDDDEREVLGSDELSRQLEAVRARHALGPADEARLLARVQREARTSIRPAPSSMRWGFLVAAAAVLLIVGTAWVVRRTPVSDAITPPAPAVATATPSPVLYLALEKPAIKISPTALAWRGPAGENTLLADLKAAWYRAVADERAGHLADARARLTRLCAAPGARSQTACGALKRLPAGRLPNP